MLKVQLSKAFRERTRRACEADAETLNLYEINPYYFSLGLRLIQMCTFSTCLLSHTTSHPQVPLSGLARMQLELPDLGSMPARSIWGWACAECGIR